MVRRTEKKRTFARMMPPEEYELLLTDEVQRAIAVSRGRDPLDVALDRTVPHARLVATQVKYLARAASKLPSSRRRARRVRRTNGSTATRRWTSPADWASMRFS